MVSETEAVGMGPKAGIPLRNSIGLPKTICGKGKGFRALLFVALTGVPMAAPEIDKSGNRALTGTQGNPAPPSIF